MFPTGYGWSHRLSNLQRYVLREKLAIHVFMQIAETVWVGVLMQIAETVVGSRRAIPFTARLQACLKRVPARDPRCPSHRPTRRASPLGCV